MKYLASAYVIAYNVGMKSMQYTIRSISPRLDEALRRRAKSSGKSLNEVVIETLEQGAGIVPEPVVYHDLDWFVGSGGFDESFDEAMAWLDSMPVDQS